MAIEEDGGPFTIGVTLAVSSKQGNYPDKEAVEIPTETGSQNISRSLQKERKHTKRVSATIRRRLTSLDLKAKVIKLRDGWQVTSRSTDSLDCLLSTNTHLAIRYSSVLSTCPNHLNTL